jgi:hypothetical protein
MRSMVEEAAATTTEPPAPRRGGAFWRGASIGLVVGVPLTAATVVVLARLGFGDAQATLGTVLEHALLFAGMPAMVVSGGIARLAARTDGPSALRTAALCAWPAAIGWLLLTVLPLGSLPEAAPTWSWLVPAGLVPGTVTGALIGRFAVPRPRPPRPPAP